MERRLQKKRRVLLAICLSVIALLLFAKDQILAKGLELYISRTLKEQGWTCGRIQWHDNLVTLDNVHGKSSSVEFSLAKVDIACHLSFFPFVFQPEVKFSGVKLSLYEVKESLGSKEIKWLGFFVGNSFFSPEVEIENGLISYPEKDLYFTFGWDHNTLWAKDVGSEEDFLRAHLEKQKEALAVNIELYSASFSSFSPLLLQQWQWDRTEGQISAQISFLVDPLVGITSCKAGVVLENLDLMSKEFSIQSRALQGTLSFSEKKNYPLWKQLELFLTFEETKFLMDQFGFEQTLGEFRLHPEEDPYLKMNGTMISKGFPVPFEVEGKGQMLPQGACWLEAKMEFFLSQRHPQIVVSFSQNESQQATLQAQYVDLGKETLDLLQGFTPLLGIAPYRMEGGQIQGKLIAQFEGKEQVSLECSDCIAKDLAIFLPREDLFFHAQEICMNGLLKQGKVHSMHARVHKADLCSSSVQIKDITSQLEVEEGAFEPSYIEGTYRGIQLSLQVLPKASEHILHLEGGAYPEDLRSWLFGEQKLLKSSAEPIFLALDVEEVAGQARFTGTVRFSGTQEDVEVEGYFPKKLSRKVSDFLSPWNLSLCKGSFQMEKFSGSTLTSYIMDVPQDLHFQGSSSVQGLFTPERVEMNFSAVDLSFTKDLAHFVCALGDVEPVKLRYLLKENKWEASVFVNSVFMEEKSLNLAVEMSESTFFYQDNRLWTDQWKIKCLGLEACGSLTACDDRAKIVVQHCEAQLPFLMGLCKKYVPFLEGIPLQGSFFVEKNQSVIVLSRGQEGYLVDWSVEGSLDHVSCPLGGNRILQDGKMTIFADSSGFFSCKNMQARMDFVTGQEPFTGFVKAKDFYWTGKEAADFSLTVGEGSRQWLFVEGKIHQETDSFVMEINPGAHIFGAQFFVTPLCYHAKGTLLPFTCMCTLQLDQVSSYGEIGKKMGFFAEQKSFPPMAGALQISLFRDSATLESKVHIEGEDVLYEDVFLGKVQGDFYNRGNLWKTDLFQLGPYQVKAGVRIKEKEWKIEELLIESCDLKLSALGSYFPDTAQLFAKSFSYEFRQPEMQICAKGSFEGGICASQSLQGKGVLGLFAVFPSASIATALTKEVPFSFDSQRGLELGPSKWEFVAGSDKKKWGQMQVQKMDYALQGKRLTMHLCNMQVSKEAGKVLQDVIPVKLIDRDFSLQFDLEVAPDYMRSSFAGKNAAFLFGDREKTVIDVKNGQILWQKPALYISCQTLCNQESVWLQLKQEAAETVITLKEQPDLSGLYCLLIKDGSGLWSLEAVKGEAKGICANIQKKQVLDKKGNFYDVQLGVDFSKVASLLPKNSKEYLQTWKIGKGYQYQGVIGLTRDSWDLCFCEGDVFAEQFQCFGRVLQSLRARVEWSPKQANIYGLQIEDETGFLSLKTISLQKDEKLQTWTFSAPLIYVRDFSPSLLLKGKKEGPLLKNISLYDVKGCLSDWKNMTATGCLNFSSLSKKESSFWDLPLNFIKDLGLDPGLLTPVSGEVDVSLAQGRCYFTALRNVCSEGERSQFELADPSRDSYLCFDGTWNVDLRLKQNVVWKMAQDFVLSIRGSVEKPKYSFKRKDSLP